MTVTIPNLTELTEVAGDDLLVIRDDSEASVEPVKRCKASTLLTYVIQNIPGGTEVDLSAFVQYDEQGRLPARDGSRLTNLTAGQISGLSTYTDERARVAQAMMIEVSVGVTAMLRYVGPDAFLPPGAVRSGAELRYTNAEGTATGTSITTGSQVPPGSWKILGATSSENLASARTSLWLRVA